MERARLPVKPKKKKPREAGLCATAKLRAAEFGLPYDLEPSEIIVPATCPVLGIPLDPQLGPEHRPTLDRVIPCLGYVKSNVRVISMRANRLKSDATAEEVALILAYIRSNAPA